MRAVILAENTALDDRYGCAHGLSVYVETQKHRILFDFGPGDLYLENAEKLGIDLRAVDIAILSHGHYDHGGGLPSFLRLNSTAPVYMQEAALGEFYARDPDRLRYIGIDSSLAGNRRLRLLKGGLAIDGQLTLVAHVTEDKYHSPSNDNLLTAIDRQLVPDRFIHEQSLVIQEDGRRLLLAGCAHCGIANILEAAQVMAGDKMTHVLAGMHLKNPKGDTTSREALAREIAGYLTQTEALYYTCHCTGQEAYRVLLEEMGEQICYTPAGTVLEF